LLKIKAMNPSRGIHGHTNTQNIDGGTMLTLQDCIELSDLSEDEILAIAEHEHIPEMVAVELGNYLVHTASGEKRIKKMIADDIAHARQTGNLAHAALLRKVLKHYLEHHHGQT
jgi:hypothetical protein